jgi:hypothetical protein
MCTHPHTHSVLSSLALFQPLKYKYNSTINVGMSVNFLELLQSWNTDILISLKHNMSKFWGQEEDHTSLLQHERQLSYLNSNMVQEILSTADTITSVNAKYKHKKTQE